MKNPLKALLKELRSQTKSEINTLADIFSIPSTKLQNIIANIPSKVVNKKIN